MKVPVIPVEREIRPMKGRIEGTSDINSLFPLLDTPLAFFSPSLISLMVSVDVKHHVYLPVIPEGREIRPQKDVLKVPVILMWEREIRPIKRRSEGTSDT